MVYSVLKMDDHNMILEFQLCLLLHLMIVYIYKDSDIEFRKEIE